MPDGIPNISAAWDLPDDERAATLAAQATLPSDLVAPGDVVGDAAWADMANRDFMYGGETAAADVRFKGDWGMTPQQRADAVSSVAFDREMGRFAESVADVAAKPPVDPAEFAAGILEARMARARRG